MKQRLDFIDAIKGFAIFLVLMGHVIPWAFQSLSEAKSIGSPMLLWHAIYAFHMPLFIFVSGFLFGQSHILTAKSLATKSLQKAQRLLIPYPRVWSTRISLAWCPAVYILVSADAVSAYNYSGRSEFLG